EAWLIKRAVESRVVVLPTGAELSGDELERRIEKLIGFRKLLQIIERRGPTRDVVLTMLDHDVRDKTFFTDPARVEALAQALTTAKRTASVQADEEHQACAIVLEDRSGGYPRRHRLDQDFVTTAEFRTLASS